MVGKAINVNMMHTSMQFSDNREQKQHDAKRIFDRAKLRNVAWLTGTEAGEDPLKTILHLEAQAHGYTFACYKSNWLAVHKAIITPGSYKVDYETIINNDFVVGSGHDPSLIWAQFKMPRIGPVTVMGSHYPRFGQPDSSDPLQRRNLAVNEKVAAAIGDKAEEFGAGKALFFYGGDQNIPDKLSDTFFGEPITSVWDELHHYEGTHGPHDQPIDVIASYNHDGRVTARYARALDDTEFFLFCDHYAVEAGYAIQTLS